MNNTKKTKTLTIQRDLWINVWNSIDVSESDYLKFKNNEITKEELLENYSDFYYDLRDYEVENEKEIEFYFDEDYVNNK